MGKKQSPFIGRRVPLVDNGVPILYPRYSSVEQILQSGAGSKRPAEAADAAATAGANGTAVEQPPAKKAKKGSKGLQAAGEQQQQQEHNDAANGVAEPQQQQQQQLSGKEAKRLKKQQQQQEQEEPKAAAAAEGDNAAQDPPQQQQQLSKKDKRKLRQQARQQQLQQQQQNGSANADQQQQQQQQQQQHEGADGAATNPPEPQGNAEEAARIRQVLGFSSGSSAAPAATATAATGAPAAAAAAKGASAAVGGGGFSFNFASLSALSADDAVAADTEVKLAAIRAVDAADKDGYVPRRVFVGGMPYSYSREQVEEYWSWCGEIQELDLLTFPDTGRFRGIAFITFKSQEGADAALACDGEQLDGQTLKVERCKAAAVAKTLKAAVASGRHQQQSQRGAHSHQQQQQQQANGAAAAGSGDGPTKTPGYNVAYVGNIAFEARPEDISALFEACNVTKVRLHTDKDTRKSKGYAHVHFADEAGLEQAINMSGTEFMGRCIKVSYGQPKRS